MYNSCMYLLNGSAFCQPDSVCHWGLSFTSHNSFLMVFSLKKDRVFQIEITNSRDGRWKQIQKDLHSKGQKRKKSLKTNQWRGLCGI